MAISEISRETERPLYELLGGQAAVAAVAENFYRRVLADPELSPFFKKTDMNRLKENQARFFSTALGGPAVYKGPNMRKAHEHLSIEQKHFDAVAGHLVAALESMSVPPPLIARLVGAVAPLAKDIVNTPATPASELAER